MSSQPLPPRPPVFPFIPPETDSLWVRVSHLEQDRFLHQHTAEPHAHQFPELIYCEQSIGTHRLGTGRQAVKSGDVFLIAPYQLHDANELTGKRWVLQFTIDVLSSESNRSTTGTSRIPWYSNPLLMPFTQPSNGRSSHLNIARQERSTLIQQLQALEMELQQQQPGYQEAARAYLTLILVKVARLTANGSPPFGAHPLLAEVFQIIEARYAESISVADVARAVGKSPSYLTTMIRRLTGRTLIEWIAEWRIAEARRLLLQTDEPLTTIAAQVGYRDVSGFIRLFRRVYGITPTEWRRANR